MRWQLRWLLFLLVLLAGCGQPAAVPPTTAPVDPALQRLAQQAIARATARQDGIWYPEDTVTFGLLVHHLRTQAPPPISAVEAALARALAGQQVPNYRRAATRGFWYTYITQINWQRFPLDQAQLLGQFDAYLDLKFAARQNRINQSLAAAVGSEEAWRRAMNAAQARDTRIRTQEQAAQAEYDAWRTVIDTEATIRAARAAIGR